MFNLIFIFLCNLPNLQFRISVDGYNKLLYNKDDLVRRNNNNLIYKTNMLSFNNINKKYKYNNLLENLEGKALMASTYLSFRAPYMNLNI